MLARSPRVARNESEPWWRGARTWPGANPTVVMSEEGVRSTSWLCIREYIAPIAAMAAILEALRGRSPHVTSGFHDCVLGGVGES